MTRRLPEIRSNAAKWVQSQFRRCTGQPNEEGTCVLLSKTFAELDLRETSGPYDLSEMQSFFAATEFRCLVRFCAWTAGTFYVLLNDKDKPVRRTSNSFRRRHTFYTDAAWPAVCAPSGRWRSFRYCFHFFF